MESGTRAAERWQQLGAFLIQRRTQLSPRFHNRGAFCEATGLKYRLIYDIEEARRTNFGASTLAAIEAAYRLEPGTIPRFLAGAVLEPPQPVTLPRPRPEPVRPQLDFSRVDPALKPFVQGVLKDVYSRIGFPPDAGPGREFPELPEDAGRLPGALLFTSDQEAGFWDDPRVLTVGEKVRSIALMRKISAEWSEKRGRKTG
jgi:hypothetical protein